jgi:beta-galactosidase
VLEAPSLAPGATALLPLPVPPDATGWLTVRWELRSDTWFAPAGHVVSWDQVALPVGSRAPRPGASRAKVADVSVPATQIDDIDPRLQLWRAPTDNDGFKLMPALSRRVGGHALARWLDAGLDHLDPESLVAHHHDVGHTEKSVVPTRSTDAPRRVASRRHRHVVDVPEELADLPRVGVTFTLPARFTWMRWFGRGPHENYPDRCASAMFGRWEGPIDESPYLVPQEFGLRTDCAWMELVDRRSGDVVRIDALDAQVPANPPHPARDGTGSATLHVAATRYSPRDLYAASTHTVLPDGSDRPVVVHVDVAQRGLGTASCGPDVLDRYRLPAGRFEFAYQLSTSRR